MHISAILATALLTGAAVAQVTIPPHSTTYVGFSRGFNFTANTSFFIVGLDLPPDAFQPGTTASYLVRVNGAVALWSIGNAGLITTNIPVVNGDVVDVIGNWSPATPTNFTARNSYGSSAPYATTIEGVPHTLNRTGWQWDIGDPTWVPTGGTGAYLAPTTGSLGRVLVYTSQTGGGGTLASNTSLGQGCIRRFASFYELFTTPAAFDLGGSGMTMVPTGGGGYLATAGATFLPVGSVQTPPTALTLGDDAEVFVPFTVGAFAGPSGPWAGLSVISNGVVSEATGNSTVAAPSVTTHLGAPQTAFRTQGDWDPSAGGTVWFEESAAVTTVTWDNVPSWNVTGSQNTFQMQFHASGIVAIAWVSLATGGANGGVLVGYSPAGPSADPGNIDLSAALPVGVTVATADAPPLTLTASSRPVTGTTWNLGVTDVPATATLGIDIFGLSDPNITDLGFLGAPGCGARASLDVLNAWVVSGSTHAYSLAIPNNPALANFHVFTQSAVFVPGANALLGGLITSNGIDGKLGTL
jgi:hypothetical protein